MRDLLISWIGRADVNAADGNERGDGPVAQALKWGDFRKVVLLSNFSSGESELAERFLRGFSSAAIKVTSVDLPNPTDFDAIYRIALQTLSDCLDEYPRMEPTIHLSPGTPAMTAVWILLSKTRFPAELIQSSPEHGVKIAAIPFDISAEYLPDLLRVAEKRIEDHAEGPLIRDPAFSDIVFRSPSMGRVLSKAKKVALHSVPVLIEGESGTGKELLARAIHRSSPRANDPFVAINCGALPAELVESELFGYVKGAFTGANKDKQGLFLAAKEGTVFLDEIGELPLESQVRILRVLQEREVTPVGMTAGVPFRARVVAATNRPLARDVQEGRFREDLYYRIAVASLRLPPLREREGDLGLLIDAMMSRIEKDVMGGLPRSGKTLSPAARNVLLQHQWPGNVRELQNTLTRVLLWSDGTTISDHDVRDAMSTSIDANVTQVLGHQLGNGFSLSDLLGNVARDYLTRALEEAAGNKTRAAGLVGLSSQQTFTNWMKRYQLRPHRPGNQ